MVIVIIDPNIIITHALILAVKVLQGLWRNDLVALKGACPNCGEEVSLSQGCVNLKVHMCFFFFFSFLYSLSLYLYFILSNEKSYVSTSRSPIVNNISMFLQVFAFVKTNQTNNRPHRADCHVCECLLEFRTKVEVIQFASISHARKFMHLKFVFLSCYTSNEKQREDNNSKI